MKTVYVAVDFLWFLKHQPAKAIHILRKDNKNIGKFPFSSYE